MAGDEQPNSHPKRPERHPSSGTVVLRRYTDGSVFQASKIDESDTGIGIQLEGEVDLLWHDVEVSQPDGKVLGGSVRWIDTKQSPPRAGIKLRASQALSLARTTLDVLRYSRKYVRSLDDEIEFHGLSIRRRVRMDIVPPDGTEWTPGQELIVPVLMPNRTEVVSNLKIKKNHTGPTRVLSHNEHGEHSTAMMLAQIEEAASTEPWAQVRTDGTTSVAYEAMVSLPVTSADDALRISRVLTDRQFIVDADADGAGDEQLEFLSAWQTVKKSRALQFLVRLFGSRYLVLVQCRADERGHVLIEFSYDSPYYQRRPRKTPLRDRIRLRFGLRSPNQRFYLGTAPNRVETFHFRMRAPRGQYVSRSQLRVVDGIVAADALANIDYAKTRPLRCDSSSLIVCAPSRPLPFAHMYCANVREDNVTALASVTFHERPPGSLGQALITALVALVPLLVITIIFRSLFGGTNRVAAGLPALLVTAPGFAALFFNLRADGRSLSAIPIVPYIGRAITGIICLAAALTLVMVQAGRDAIWWHGAPASLSVPDAGQLVMGLLLVAQLSLVFILWFRLRVSEAQFLRDDFYPGVLDRIVFYLVEHLSRASKSVNRLEEAVYPDYAINVSRKSRKNNEKANDGH